MDFPNGLTRPQARVMDYQVVIKRRPRFESRVLPFLESSENQGPCIYVTIYTRVTAALALLGAQLCFRRAAGWGVIMDFPLGGREDLTDFPVAIGRL